MESRYDVLSKTPLVLNALLQRKYGKKSYSCCKSDLNQASLIPKKLKQYETTLEPGP
jgi:hypothetical protein